MGTSKDPVLKTVLGEDASEEEVKHFLGTKERQRSLAAKIISDMTPMEGMSSVLQNLGRIKAFDDVVNAIASILKPGEKVVPFNAAEEVDKIQESQKEWRLSAPITPEALDDELDIVYDNGEPKEPDNIIYMKEETTKGTLSQPFDSTNSDPLGVFADARLELKLRPERCECGGFKYERHSCIWQDIEATTKLLEESARLGDLKLYDEYRARLYMLENNLREETERIRRPAIFEDAKNNNDYPSIAKGEYVKVTPDGSVAASLMGDKPIGYAEDEGKAGEYVGIRMMPSYVRFGETFRVSTQYSYDVNLLSTVNKRMEERGVQSRDSAPPLLVERERDYDDI